MQLPSYIEILRNNFVVMEVKRIPIIRKVLEVGNSKCIAIPKSWFKFIENETGQEVKEVAIVVNRKLTIEPYFKRKEK